jgi:hypothetical protein
VYPEPDTVYRVIRAPTTRGLEEKVNRKIREGWEVTGGLIVETHAEGRTFYAQAMIFTGGDHPD